ncbi:MAG: hypothetical protein HXX19_19685 [Rhodoferax sp.]|nr:hypothetical protein [Rhodoferax sp.]
MDAGNLPTRRLDHDGLNTGCGSLDIDHCFDGWDGQLQLSEGGLRMTVSSDLDCLVVYTQPGRNSMAIEPVSHVNNALALARQRGQSPASLGIRVLQPGDSFAARMRIQVEQLA